MAESIENKVKWIMGIMIILALGLIVNIIIIVTGNGSKTVYIISSVLFLSLAGLGMYAKYSSANMPINIADNIMRGRAVRTFGGVYKSEANHPASINVSKVQGRPAQLSQEEENEVDRVIAEQNASEVAPLPDAVISPKPVTSPQSDPQLSPRPPTQPSQRPVDYRGGDNINEKGTFNV